MSLGAGRGPDGGGGQPLDGRSLALSAAVHAAALAALIWVVPALRSEPVLYQTIEVRIVSPPPAPAPPREEEEPADTPPPQEDELVVETPDEQEPEVAEEAPVAVPEPPAPEEDDAPTPEPQDPPPPEDAPPPATDDPPPEPEDAPPPDAAPSEPDESRDDEGGEDIDVRMEGVRSKFPGYWQNIIRQVNRCFIRPPEGSSREAVVDFVIRPDGSAADIDVSASSGSMVFDWRVMAAIECAGGRFGPLPEGYEWDVMPIRFTLRPESAPEVGPC